uniref:Uncharacterized protein n=1 Tax=Compsopogon caeruleus TaxID=31354 RepID=A0A7S1XG31_9RHOD|mmetsp:Transcript_5070/g.10289  ORF Transcript_5070/g.10289 Transcript_5070/m.10289 type:complete len:655 (+) Transcript_5070:426-2390(+)|eukprot:CAMPEP_0184684822 /NCGR_PEP_ID=MMETSP0312-20130426/16806_1 /TAXON_ID=31354 /ORGANISM="Compsopogon coeruleus, Strain SAG 36.94" /LENGTH=654 /DNA_ID=CAMNT_0027138397 /DNA_START=406 /DNA_END=2370 /DNA_ORIENTATION=-
MKPGAVDLERLTASQRSDQQRRLALEVWVYLGSTQLGMELVRPGTLDSMKLPSLVGLRQWLSEVYSDEEIRAVWAQLAINVMRKMISKVKEGGDVGMKFGDHDLVELISTADNFSAEFGREILKGEEERFVRLSRLMMDLRVLGLVNQALWTEIPDDERGRSFLRQTFSEFVDFYKEKAQYEDSVQKKLWLMKRDWARAIVDWIDNREDCKPSEVPKMILEESSFDKSIVELGHFIEDLADQFGRPFLEEATAWAFTELHDDAAFVSPRKRGQEDSRSPNPVKRVRLAEPTAFRDTNLPPSNDRDYIPNIGNKVEEDIVFESPDDIPNAENSPRHTKYRESDPIVQALERTEAIHDGLSGGSLVKSQPTAMKLRWNSEGTDAGGSPHPQDEAAEVVTPVASKYLKDTTAIAVATSPSRTDARQFVGLEKELHEGLQEYGWGHWRMIAKYNMGLLKTMSSDQLKRLTIKLGFTAEDYPGTSRRVTAAEERLLLDGLRKYGWGHWEEILDDGGFEPHRTASDLEKRAKSSSLFRKRDFKSTPTRPSPKPKQVQEDEADDPAFTSEPEILVEQSQQPPETAPESPTPDTTAKKEQYLSPDDGIYSQPLETQPGDIDNGDSPEALKAPFTQALSAEKGEKTIPETRTRPIRSARLKYT